MKYMGRASAAGSPGGFGAVYIIGAGPGDPELITVKALKLLSGADVVLYDRLVPRELLGFVKPGARLIYVGKEPGRAAMSQDEINRVLVEEAKRGMAVARLHGGDPFVFGRGFEECSYVVSHGIRCEVVPGVTSAIAAPEKYMIPPVLRGVASSFAVITGTEDPGKGRRFVDPGKVASAVDTLIVLMGAGAIGRIASDIVGAGVRPDTPVAVIVNAYRPGEEFHVYTLSTVPEKVSNPAVIVIGDVVKKALALLGHDTTR